MSFSSLKLIFLLGLFESVPVKIADTRSIVSSALPDSFSCFYLLFRINKQLRIISVASDYNFHISIFMGADVLGEIIYVFIPHRYLMVCFIAMSSSSTAVYQRRGKPRNNNTSTKFIDFDKFSRQFMVCLSKANVIFITIYLQCSTHFVVIWTKLSLRDNNLIPKPVECRWHSPGVLRATVHISESYQTTRGSVVLFPNRSASSFHALTTADSPEARSLCQAWKIGRFNTARARSTVLPPCFIKSSQSFNIAVKREKI